MELRIRRMIYKILRQYKTCGYFVDGYIPELNLAIEVDEQQHLDLDGNLKQIDVNRENLIKNKLGCKFVRINDYD